MSRKTLIEERSLRDAQKGREHLVLLNLRFHKLHAKQPDTSMLVFAAGSTQEGSKLLVRSMSQVITLSSSVGLNLDIEMQLITDS